jgi:hypothetical protein
MNASMREFLTWVSDTPRTYDDAMYAWRSSCPRFTIWEDALEEQLIKVSGSQVALTSDGRIALAQDEHRTNGQRYC